MVGSLTYDLHSTRVSIHTNATRILIHHNDTSMILTEQNLIL